MIEPVKRPLRPPLQVIKGSADGASREARIAFSLVHSHKRLDVPVDAVAVDTIRHTATIAHVRIWLAPVIRQKLCAFTQDIVDTAMEIHIQGQCVLKPILREPLGQGPFFFVSFWDVAEAEALAKKLRDGWRPVSAVNV